MVFGDGAEHRPGEPLAGAAVRDLADVDGEDRAARPLDALDDLGLDGERADEPVEVRDDDDVGLAASTISTARREPGTLVERRAAGHVELLERVDELRARRARRPRRYARAARRVRRRRRPVAERRRGRRRRRDAREATMVAEGEPAPDFTLTSDSGETVTLSSFRGKPVILYFYPKDDTPGCTTQACGIRDA